MHYESLLIADVQRPSFVSRRSEIIDCLFGCLMILGPFVESTNISFLLANELQHQKQQ
jgi:hypothetical protein